MAIAKKTETKATVEKEAVKAAEKEPAKAAAPVTPATKAPVEKASAEKATAEAEKKAPAKKEAAKKTAAPKKEAAPKKTAAKESTAKLFIQYEGREILADELVEEAKKAFVNEGNKVSDIKTIEVYVKPEENAAYYVVNGEGSDDRKISL